MVIVSCAVLLGVHQKLERRAKHTSLKETLNMWPSMRKTLACSSRVAPASALKNAGVVDVIESAWAPPLVDSAASKFFLALICIIPERAISHTICL